MRRRLAAVGLLLVLAGVLAAQLRLETRLTVFFLGAGGEAGMLGRLQQTRFARRYLLLIELAQGERSVTPFARRLRRQLARVEGVARVWSLSEPPLAFLDLLQDYADHAEVIYSLDPAREAPQLFDPATLPRRAENLRQALLSSYGDWVQAIARRDPLLLTLHALEDWRDRLRPRRHGNFEVLVIESAADAFALDRQRVLQQRLRQLLDTPEAGTYRLTLTGVPVFAVRAQERIQRDVARVTAASTLGVLAVFLGLFRTLRSLLAVAVVLAFAAAAGALATQLVFGYVHALTLALGGTLVGVCIDYPIHVLAHCGGREPRAVVRRLWPALMLGGGTTLIGYLALGATGYPGFEQVAVFAGAGIVAALLATGYFLPDFIAAVCLRRPRLRPLTAWLGFARRHRKGLQLAAVLAVAAAGAAWPRLQWLDDLEKLAAVDPELKRQDRQLRARLGGIEPGRAVLVEAPDLETALQRAETATLVLRRLRETRALAGFQPLYPWYVSQSLQARNWRQYQSHVTPEFVAAWRRALATAGLTVEPLSQLVRSEPPWLPVPDPRLAEILVGQVRTRQDRAELAIWLGSHDPDAVRAALAGLEGVRYFSQHDHVNRLAQQYRRRALKTLAAGVAVIWALLAWRYRSPLTALQLLAPPLLGGTTILIGFAAAGFPLSFFHLLAALLAIAICVDYAIFYRERRGGDIAATYQAMGASMLTTVTAFAALGLASQPVLQALALAVTCGVVSGFLWCPVLVVPLSESMES
ncbi:hypothetical protein MIN45_P2262 [Methylomarinovum tepidoasis]|uniref:Membrane transport protein MMPL domain-containing protein n=1 Tax=Methylomarinovum tepidoasis TaxID=2840183 RepID=A0AAU9CHW6_9GAMM|nr:MMPL family transporter [Methylomarinovum sp. IN45]BCX89888.1 hypothetical protein MIN45_P2262 [Methylomarinovum sp. IN45]